MSGFFTEALVWGFLFSFGVFQEYYSSHEPFAGHDGVALIGTYGSGVAYIGSLFVFATFVRWPATRLLSLYLGAPVIIVALLAASFATTVDHLILTQGVLYGIGGALLYNPVVDFLDEWFVRRKGFAFGVMWAGTGVAGVTIPFIMAAGLDRWGSSTMLRVWAVVVAVLAVPALLFVRPRVPLAASGRSRRFSFRFFFCSAFWVLQITNLVQGLGYFMPGIYLPSYASAVGMGPTAGTLTLSLVNGASVIGSIVIGALVDRWAMSTVIAIVSMIAAFSSLVVWGLSITTPALLLFSLVYGVSAGGFSTMYIGMVHEIQKHENSADPGLMFGLLATGRGLGSVLAGPLSGLLLKQGAWTDHAALGYGTEYGPLIVFTGTTAAVGTSSWILHELGWF